MAIANEEDLRRSLPTVDNESREQLVDFSSVSSTFSIFPRRAVSSKSSWMQQSSYQTYLEP